MTNAKAAAPQPGAPSASAGDSTDREASSVNASACTKRAYRPLLPSSERSRPRGSSPILLLKGRTTRFTFEEDCCFSMRRVLQRNVCRRHSEVSAVTPRSPSQGKRLWLQPAAATLSPSRIDVTAARGAPAARRPMSRIPSNRNCAGLERLNRNSEAVANAALGLDNARRARVGLQLASQPQDLDVDAAVEDVFVDARRLEQVLAAQRALRRLEEGQQQGVFALAQRDRCIGGIDQPATTAFELPAIEPIAAALGIAGARGPSHLLTPQHGADARQELPQAERLDDVIVGTELKADDAVDLVGPVPGRDDDRHIGMRTDLPQQVEPIVLTEAKIENDQAGLRSLQMKVQFGPVGCGLARYIVLFQISNHHLPQGGIVIDNDDMADVCQHIDLSNLP